LYGPSGTVSVRTTLVPANTITTAVMAGETYGSIPRNSGGKLGVEARWIVASLVGAVLGGWTILP